MGRDMSCAEGPCFVDAMRDHPERLPGYLAAMAQLQFRVHSHPGTRLGGLKVRLAGDISRATMLGEARRNVLLEQLAAMPEGERLCHGDFHPLNILGPVGREVLVDWLDATRGDPATDVCRSFVLMRHWASEAAAAYVEAYAGVGGETPETGVQVASVRCRRPARGRRAGRGRRIDGDGGFPLEPVGGRAGAAGCDVCCLETSAAAGARVTPLLQFASLFRRA